mgnify:CR=1 FL=1
MAEFCHYYGLDAFTGQEGLQHSVGTVPSGPFQLAVHFWQNSAARGTLLLLHGYFDHCGLYGKTIKYGLSRGYKVIIIQLPGSPHKFTSFVLFSRHLYLLSTVQ